MPETPEKATKLSGIILPGGDPTVLRLIRNGMAMFRVPVNVDWPNVVLSSDYCAGWATPDGRPYPARGIKRCPFDKPGQRLFVKEAWWQDSRWPDLTVIYAATPEFGVEPNHPYKVIRSTFLDGELPTREESERNCRECKWKSVQPAETMPEWAARLLIETTVRVERIQEISEEDAKLSGVDWVGDGAAPYGVKGIAESWGTTAKNAYRFLWDANNPGHLWENNGHVWVVEARKVEIE